MDIQLLKVHPCELEFLCEVNKRSSCGVHLLNTTDQYVAFKVKTTSPEKYCLDPNQGIIKPKETYDFRVFMLPPESVPSDMQCNDIFWIVSTIVPCSISEEEITPSMFATESQKYIEETKLRVLLTRAQSSLAKRVQDLEELNWKLMKDNHELRLKITAMDSMLRDMKIKAKVEKSVTIPENERLKKHQEKVELDLVKENNGLKSKISDMESKLFEAEYTIDKLKEKITILENERLKKNQEVKLKLIKEKMI